MNSTLALRGTYTKIEPEVIEKVRQAWGITIRDGYAAGVLEVRGTASAPAEFNEYRLFVGLGATPAEWQLLRRSPVPITASMRLVACSGASCTRIRAPLSAASSSGSARCAPA